MGVWIKMNWNLLEAYITVLLDGIAIGDLNTWEAKEKFRVAIKDFKKSYTIIPKQNFDNIKPSIPANELVDGYNKGELTKDTLTEEELLALIGYAEGFNTLRMQIEESEGGRDRK